MQKICQISLDQMDRAVSVKARQPALHSLCCGTTGSIKQTASSYPPP